MAVSNVVSTQGYGVGEWRGTIKQGKEDFSQLLNALQSGDLIGAQQAYAAMQQLLPTAGGATTSDANGAAVSAVGATNGSVTTDFQALGAALNSGNLDSVRAAVTTLEDDARSYLENVGGSASTSVKGGLGGLKDELAALGQSLKAGDTSSAQDTFAKIQQDLQTVRAGLGVGPSHRWGATQSALSSYVANAAMAAGNGNTVRSGTQVGIYA